VVKKELEQKKADGSTPCLSSDQCESLKQLLKEDVKLMIKTGLLSQVRRNHRYLTNSNRSTVLYLRKQKSLSPQLTGLNQPPNSSSEGFRVILLVYLAALLIL